MRHDGHFCFPESYFRRFIFETTDKMWSPGGKDFSSGITDFVTLITSHTIFFVNYGIPKFAFGMSWAEGRFYSIGFEALSR